MYDKGSYNMNARNTGQFPQIKSKNMAGGGIFHVTEL
jgi:hypothetical protein